MPFPLGISDSQKKVPPLPPAVVSQSDSGSGRPFDDGAAYLTFQDTTFTGKLPIIEYVITATSTDNLETVNQTVNLLTPFTITGLKSGKSYKFKVKARNSVSDSAYSSEFGPGTATTVPGRPTSLAGTDQANGSNISLSWTAPANAGKSITSYLITPNIGATIETGNSSTSYTFSGTLGTAYNFTVAARNENGLGQASTTSNLITITQYVAPTPTPTPPTVGGTTVGGTTVGGTTVGGTTVGGTTVTCGACQDVSGTVTYPTCNGEDSYVGYYQKRAQICSDGSQIPCTGTPFLYFGSLIKTCESSCGCTVTVSPCSPLAGTTCGTYSAGCGYVGTYNCAGGCTGLVCQGCCACDPAFCTTTVGTTTVGTTTVGTTTVGTTTVGTTTVGTTTVGGAGTPTSPCGARCQCTALGGIWRSAGCLL